MRTTWLSKAWPATLTLSLVTGCTVSYPPGGGVGQPLAEARSTDRQLPVQQAGQCGTTRGLFRGTWFDYYERALSFADCRLWQASASDFDQALGKRSRDTRNAYQLGLHFSDYFPHRELGIALYHLGRFTEAARELETSLEQFPTSKATLYLKRARLKLIEAGGLDKERPLIVVTSPPPRAVLNTASVEVSGRVTDDSYVEAIEVNGVPVRPVKTVLVEGKIPVRAEQVASEVSFAVTVPVPWQNGEGTLRVVATDITGKRAEYTQTVRLDRNGPVIALTQVAKASADALRFQAHIEDAESGLARLSVNGRDVQLPPDGTITFDQKIPTGPGEAWSISAEDRAGNQTLARASAGETGAGQPPLRLTIEQGLERFTHETSVYLQGVAESAGEITALTVNGHSLLRQPGRKVFFSFVGELAVGGNAFRVIASDTAGNRQEANVQITREVPSVHTLLERLVVAQLPFSCNEMTQAPCAASAGLYDEVLALMETRKRFRLIERLKLKDIVHEQLLCRSGITEKCALAVGNLLFAEALFVGDILERTDGSGDVSVEINGRMVDVATRDVLMHVDAYGEHVDRAVLKDISRGLVLELSDAFPLVEGNILDVKGDRLTVDLTGKDRVWEKMPILVYRDEEVIQNRIQTYSKCGNGRLAAVRESASLAEVEEDACHDIQPGVYKVITK